jgi:predicted transcriptional regulator/bacterioferritin-associated ferredoxin
MTKEVEEYQDTILDRAQVVEQVGLYKLKGYRISEISELTGVSQNTVREYISQYERWIEKQVEDDPYFLEKVQHNTLRAMNELDEISKEAWETVEIATREGMVSARNQALKLCLDVSTKKAQLFQLMGGGNKSDSEYIARMQRAETVNQLISNVIRDVISECPKCRDLAKPMLREAFAMMEVDNREGFATPKEAEDHLDFEDGEIIDDDEDAI